MLLLKKKVVVLRDKKVVVVVVKLIDSPKAMGLRPPVSATSPREQPRIGPDYWPRQAITGGELR